MPRDHPWVCEHCQKKAISEHKDLLPDGWEKTKSKRIVCLECAMILEDERDPRNIPQHYPPGLYSLIQEMQEAGLPTFVFLEAVSFEELKYGSSNYEVIRDAHGFLKDVIVHLHNSADKVFIPRAI